LCSATTKVGEPCRAPAVADGKCRVHAGLVDVVAAGKLGGRPRKVKPEHEPDLTVKSKRGFFDTLRGRLDDDAELVVDAVLKSRNPVGISKLAELAYQRGEPETAVELKEGPPRLESGKRIVSLADVCAFAFEIGQGHLLSLDALHDRGLLVPELERLGLLVDVDGEDDEAVAPS
jgi:hypothetical protein